MMAFEVKDGELVCELPARMDTAACAAGAGTVLKRMEEEGRPVVFDMAGVEFVASAFIRLCLQAHKLAGPGRFRIVRVSPAVKKVFKLAGLDVALNLS